MYATASLQTRCQLMRPFLAALKLAHVLCGQGAYGIMAEVESHPFPLDTMLFMDWRDDYTAGDGGMAVRPPASLWLDS